MARFVCSSCRKLKYRREDHNLREYFVCDQRGCNARLIRRSYIIVKHLKNKHHLSEYEAREHAVAANKIPSNQATKVAVFYAVL